MRAWLNVSMRIPLLEETLLVDYKGSLGTMDAAELNQMIKPNSKVSFKKGEIKTIDFRGTVTGRVSQGELLANYRSFKVRIHKKRRKKEKPDFHFSATYSFRKIIKIKRGEITYTAAKQDGFFKILWSGIKNGLADTLLPGMLIPTDDKGPSKEAT